MKRQPPKRRSDSATLKTLSAILSGIFVGMQVLALMVDLSEKINLPTETFIFGGLFLVMIALKFSRD